MCRACVHKSKKKKKKRKKKKEETYEQHRRERNKKKNGQSLTPNIKKALIPQNVIEEH